jgi:hypothetical protein
MSGHSILSCIYLDKILSSRAGEAHVATVIISSASGLGRAVVERLVEMGATVMARVCRVCINVVGD